MRNRLLNVVKNIIPYVKELRQIAGSVTAVLLWQQLDYWFEREPDGFFKFLSPCKNKAYRKGDSWTEELGFSKAEFRKAFSHIGIAYKSKREFDQATDKFMDSKGKTYYFCSYHDKIKGITWYFRNHDYADNALDNLLKKEETPLQVNVVNLHKSTNFTCVDQQTSLTEVNKVDPHSYTEITTKITTDTTTTCSSKKNFKEKKELLFDYNLAKTTEEDRRKMLLIMKDIPEEEQQEILDELNSAMDDKDKVTDMLRYLHGIVKKYKKGQFNPTNRLPQKRLKRQKEEEERQQERQKMQERTEMPEEIKRWLRKRK